MLLKVSYNITDDHKLIKDLDELGVSCVWTAEAYGYDAVTPLAYFAALTPFVGSYIIGETLKKEDGDNETEEDYEDQITGEPI